MYGTFIIFKWRVFFYLGIQKKGKCGFVNLYFPLIKKGPRMHAREESKKSRAGGAALNPNLNKAGKSPLHPTLPL